ncbi:hypothetical protein [Desulfonatronospira sp.]|uniref:ISAzo13-like element transposase-related protein n=1 Tax=Desulfonatronospira sp. TaxID=1962951 RepID=UPI00344AA267
MTSLLGKGLRQRRKNLDCLLIFVKSWSLTFIFYTDSNKTSDFMVDGLLLWWNENKDKQHFSTVTNLVVNMDNGPECSGRRSQFLLRMVEFADITQLTVRLTYYPPYHSKYKCD